MDELHNRFSWKVWVGILIGLAMILLLLLFIPMFFSRPEEKISRVTPSARPVISPIQKENWETINTEKYSVQYPDGWNIRRGHIDGGGEYAMIQPKVFPNGGVFPRIDILIYAKNNDRQIENLSYQLEANEFKKRNVTFLGKSAIEYESIMKGATFVQGNPNKYDVKKVVYIFEHNNFIYEVDYGFYDGIQDGFIETSLEEVMKSLELN